jgi:enoyl-[acyl-carrier protein] reductase II
MGTRFMTCTKATISEDWERCIVASHSEDTVKILFADAVFPPSSPGSYSGRSPRVLHPPFVDEWNARLGEVPAEAERLRGHKLVPFTEQTTGMIREIMPVGALITSMLGEAERELQLAAGHTLR